MPLLTKENPKVKETSCLFCGVSFLTYIVRARIYCSGSCRSKNGNFCKGASHTNWIGNHVGYWGVHKWLSRNFKKPTMCERCGKDNLSGRSIHWANISGLYKRDRGDYLALCQSCHRTQEESVPRIKGKRPTY